MVGVCLTVIGLIRVVITLGKADTIADDLLALDAMLFLLSCLLSYSALRSRGLRRMHRIERAADGLFIAAMIVMTMRLRIYHLCDDPADSLVIHFAVAVSLCETLRIA